MFKPKRIPMVTMVAIMFLVSLAFWDTYIRAGTLEFDGVPVDITTTTSEDLVIVPGEGGNTQIGDGTGTNTNATSNDDLHVTGSVESDGIIYSDSGIVSGSSIISDTDSTDSLGSATISWANLYVDAIRTVSGTNLTLLPTSAYTIIGDAGIAGQASSNDDLFVSGILEVDGTLYADGDLAVGTSDLFVDNSAGRVGIGTTGPGAILEIKNLISGATPTSVKIIAGTTSPDNFALQIQDYEGVDKVVVLDSGWVGIGITAPLADLHVAGDVKVDGSITISGSVIDDTYVPYTGANSTVDLGSQALTTSGTITAPNLESTTTDLQLGVNSGTNFLIYRYGGAPNNYFYPEDDGVVDLGTIGGTGHKWRDLWLSGDANIGGDVNMGSNTADLFTTGDINGEVLSLVGNAILSTAGSTVIRAGTSGTPAINIGAADSISLNPGAGQVRLGGPTVMRSDTLKTSWGTEDDVSIGFNGADMIINSENATVNDEIHITNFDNFTVNATGIGIFDSSPSVALDVTGDMQVSSTVGIGATDATAKLSVTNLTSGTTPTSFKIIAGDTNADFALQIQDSLLADKFVVLDNGKVGIGTTSPSQELHVAGDVLVSGTLTTGTLTTTGAITSTGAQTIDVSSTAALLVEDTGTKDDVLRVDTVGGYVGINKEVPTVALDVVGDITATGTITSPTVSNHPHQNVILNASPTFNTISGSILNIVDIDLGTNTIADGQFTGLTWDFDNGSLIDIDVISAGTVNVSVDVNATLDANIGRSVNILEATNTAGLPIYIVGSANTGIRGRIQSNSLGTDAFANWESRARAVNDSANLTTHSLSITSHGIGRTGTHRWGLDSPENIGGWGELLQIGGAGLAIGTLTTGMDLILGTEKNLALTIDGSTQNIVINNNLRIGSTAAPTKALDVTGDVLVSGTLTTGTLSLTNFTTTGVVEAGTLTDGMLVITGGDLTTTGNIGLGKASPVYEVDIEKNTAAGNTGNFPGIRISNINVSSTFSLADLRVDAGNSAVQMRIFADGLGSTSITDNTVAGAVGTKNNVPFFLVTNNEDRVKIDTALVTFNDDILVGGSAGRLTVESLILPNNSAIFDSEDGWTRFSGDGSTDDGLDIAIPQVAGDDFYYGFGGTEDHFFSGILYADDIGVGDDLSLGGIIDFGITTISAGLMTGNWDFGSGSILTTSTGRFDAGIGVGINPSVSLPIYALGNTNTQFSVRAKNTNDGISASARLQAWNNANAVLNFILSSSNFNSYTRLGQTMAGAGALETTATKLTILTINTGTPLFLGTENILAMTIDGSNQDIYIEQKLGIGTTAPSVALDVTGDVLVSGTLTTTTLVTTGDKTFLIDHPLDPKNKILRHSVAESPERMNIYKGRAKLADGEVAIDLPDYFDALNAPDAREINLTCIGGWSPLYLEGEIKDNKFVVKTIEDGKQNQEFSWVIYAVRNDLYARDHPFIVEEEKSEGGTYSKGEYLYPEGYEGKYKQAAEDKAKKYPLEAKLPSDKRGL